MTVHYTFSLVSTCPADHGADLYEVTVTAARMLPVEKILEVAKRLAAHPIYQEDLTEQLARELAANVQTTATHYGVLTVCEA